MRSFKPYPNERDSVKQAREDEKHRVTLIKKILVPLPTRTSFQKYSRSSNFSQNLFPPKGNLVNAQQKKNKNGERKAKEAGKRERGM